MPELDDETLKELGRLALKVGHDPKTRRDFFQAVKKIAPERYAAQADQIMQDKIDELTAKIEQDKIERKTDEIRIQTEAARKALAARYNELFAGSKVVTPKEMPYAHHVYHLYVVVVEDREALKKALTEQGIENGLHYPVPLHLQKAYAYLGYKKGDFPVSEHVASNHVSLPMYAELPIEHVEHVAKTIREVLECQAVPTSRQ